MYRAYHRFLSDYCAPFPGRLTGVLLVSPRDPTGSIGEMRRCANEDWPVGILPICPPAMTLDDPEWEKVRQAAKSFVENFSGHTNVG